MGLAEGADHGRGREREELEAYDETAWLDRQGETSRATGSRVVSALERWRLSERGAHH
jgi:hypothetical protein